MGFGRSPLVTEPSLPNFAKRTENPRLQNLGRGLDDLDC